MAVQLVHWAAAVVAPGSGGLFNRAVEMLDEGGQPGGGDLGDRCAERRRSERRHGDQGPVGSRGPLGHSNVSGAAVCVIVMILAVVADAGLEPMPAPRPPHNTDASRSLWPKSDRVVLDLGARRRPTERPAAPGNKEAPVR
ncbi:hypothetical protein GCM10010390_13130 [Streptomyces mordarskii]|uniref:Uncharacterized protein n=1 Tax=Streptomyces mordarskii TaxID=1226758 RepID=A0ABN1C550_9ACTN